MTVRELAAKKGFEVVGKLRRMSERKSAADAPNKKPDCRYYIDEAGNEFWLELDGSNGCIVTKDGGVI